MPAPRRERVRTVNDMPSRTVQSDRHNAELRHILERTDGQSIVEQMRDVDLTYKDVSQFEDFADLMRQTKQAELQFMRLPSKLREVFGHDVLEWLDAAHDPEKLEAVRPRLEELGLMDPVEVKTPEPDPKVVINAEPTEE